MLSQNTAVSLPAVLPPWLNCYTNCLPGLAIRIEEEVEIYKGNSVVGKWGGGMAGMREEEGEKIEEETRDKEVKKCLTASGLFKLLN